LTSGHSFYILGAIYNILQTAEKTTSFSRQIDGLKKPVEGTPEDLKQEMAP
jgi:hypothetical protein